MQPAPNAAKYNERCDAWEDNKVPRAGKHSSTDRCKAREDMSPVPNAGKHATGVNKGKACNRCQERENMQPARENIPPMPRKGKHTTGTKSGKTNNRCQA